MGGVQMKRYWKITSVLLIMVVAIGAFYIQSSFAAKNKLSVEFKKLSGDEDEIKNLVIHGSYIGVDQFQSLKIMNKKTTILENQSIFQTIEGNANSPIFGKMIDNYRSFMRSKARYPGHFYEDKKLLAYANIKGFSTGPFVRQTNNFSFDIKVLDKKSEEIKSIELDLPNTEKYDWIQVEDVQVIKGKLKAFTRFTPQRGGIELRVYTFDLEKQKFVNKATINFGPKVENGWTDIEFISDPLSMKPQKYHLMSEVVKTGEGQGQVGSSKFNQEIYIYNIDSNQSKKLTIPDELQLQIDSSAILNSTIFTYFESEDGFEIRSYDIEKDQWGKNSKFHGKQKGDNTFFRVMNGKLYIISSTKNGHTIFIGDVKTGKPLYEGELKLKKEAKEKQKDYKLYLDEIEFVN